MGVKITNFINNNNSLLKSLGGNQKQRNQAAQNATKSGSAYKMRRGLVQTQKQKDEREKLGNAFLKPFENTKIDIFASSSYIDSLRNQRISGQDAKLAVKKMRYNFKSLSSKIIRSKTSNAARQAAGQARREVVRLKREAQAANAKGEKVDDEELQAEITHAKAMERVAKKKVKHLEEEEMARAKGGICQGSKIDDEELEKELEKQQDAWEQELERRQQESGDLSLEAMEEYEDMMASEGGETISYNDNDISLEDYADITMADLSQIMAEYSDNEVFMEEFVANMEDLSGEMLSEMSEEMQELMEDMGLDELMDASAASGDMDPEDLKQMIIKHRNKEMKDIVKADSDYLKAVFKALENQKANPGSNMPAPSAPAMGFTGGSGFSSGAELIGAVNPTINQTPAMPSAGGDSSFDISI